MADMIRTAGDDASHAWWLHELRNAVSLASVATAMGRRLVHDDAPGSADALAEAEQALAECRALLSAASEHLRSETRPTVLLPTPGATRAARIDEAPARRRRGDTRMRIAR